MKIRDFGCLVGIQQRWAGIYTTWWHWCFDHDNFGLCLDDLHGSHLRIY